jgi:hypothetical protein
MMYVDSNVVQLPTSCHLARSGFDLLRIQLIYRQTIERAYTHVVLPLQSLAKREDISS